VFLLNVNIQGGKKLREGGGEVKKRRCGESSYAKRHKERATGTKMNRNSSTQGIQIVTKERKGGSLDKEAQRPYRG